MRSRLSDVAGHGLMSLTGTSRLGLTWLLLLLLAALPSFADDKWVDEYDRGVAAVRAKNYEAGAVALQRTIAQMPNEGNSVRVRREIIVYVPHFWLGIAKLNLGDPDGALREWQTSEEQGVVQNTIYYAQMREWVARAQSQKQRNSENAASESRKAARAALDRALSMQMEAISGDRTDSYRAAKQKLQEANDAFKRAGTDVRVYQHVADVASQAGELFAAAAEEGKRQKARPPAVAQKPPVKPAQQPTVDSVAVVIERPKSAMPAPAPLAPAPLTPAPMPGPAKAEPPVESAALANARLAVQAYRRRLIDAKRPTAEAAKLDGQLGDAASATTIQQVLDEVARRERELTPKPVDLSAKNPTIQVPPADAASGSRAQIESAYRAFASGNLDTTERILTSVLASNESADALMLRGCARYTRAMLSRKAASQLDGATADFRSALKLDSSLRLDRNAFSPKLVAFFDQVKSGR